MRTATAPASPPSPAARLRREDRRAQLLDVAATLLLEQGPPALTMERLAQHAGVSKALPYLHFSNSEAVLAELYRREVEHLGMRVLEARAEVSEDNPDGRLAAALGAYFDVVAERGDVFAVLARAGVGRRQPTGPDAASDEDLGPDFVAGLLREDFGLAPHRATVAADVLMGAIDGATRGWARGRIRRREAERAVLDAAQALVARR